jgi:hypothetical protein
MMNNHLSAVITVVRDRNSTLRVTGVGLVMVKALCRPRRCLG